MPLYTFQCENCDHTEEHLISLANRDSTIVVCIECGKAMLRLIDAPVIGKPAFQMSAILDSGKKVPGHFGKEAKKK